MAGRRRRRERRPRHVEAERGPAHGSSERAGAKAESRRREAFELRMARLRRIRTVVGALGFVPLVASLLAASGVEILGVVPREIYLGIWAAIFGTFLGLTVRMWRERRAFKRGASS
ncbi:MAG: hypothetical protein ACRDGT_13235 [Candidatus Limnocylindria bacterium]